MESASPLDLSTMAGRIAWLLIHLFDGNMRRMAEAIGVTHCVVSKVVGGRQDPGRRFLEAIASHPKVNPAWVYSGEGEPLLATRRTGPGEVWEAPIADVILPGPPTEHDRFFTNTSFPFAGDFDRTTRYIYRVGGGDPIVFEDSEKVAPGDLLLLDADAGLWKTNRRILAGALVALRIENGDGFDYVLARIRTDSRTGKFAVFPYMREDVPTAASSGERRGYVPTVVDVRSGRAIDLDLPPLPTIPTPTDLTSRKPPEPSVSPPSEPVRPVEPQVPLVDAIVAICVMLIRR